MRRVSIWIVGVISGLGLAGCAADRAVADDDAVAVDEQTSEVPPNDPCQPSYWETTTATIAQQIVGTQCDCTLYKLCTTINTYGHNQLCDPPVQLSYLKSSVTSCGDTVYSSCADAADANNAAPPPCP